jgi:hypothetical protein
MFWAEARTPAKSKTMMNIERMRPGLYPIKQAT